LPCHPAFIHGLQVLQGWECRRWREFFNGGVSWEDKENLVTSLGDFSKLVVLPPHRTLGGRGVPAAPAGLSGLASSPQGWAGDSMLATNANASH
jgi:hypothetical protein